MIDEYDIHIILFRFIEAPSLLPAARFLIESVQRYPEEKCQICKQGHND